MTRSPNEFLNWCLGDDIMEASISASYFHSLLVGPDTSRGEWVKSCIQDFQAYSTRVILLEIYQAAGELREDLVLCGIFTVLQQALPERQLFTGMTQWEMQPGREGWSSTTGNTEWLVSVIMFCFFSLLLQEGQSGHWKDHLEGEHK